MLSRHKMRVIIILLFVSSAYAKLNAADVRRQFYSMRKTSDLNDLFYNDEKDNGVVSLVKANVVKDLQSILAKSYKKKFAGLCKKSMNSFCSVTNA